MFKSSMNYLFLACFLFLHPTISGSESDGWYEQMMALVQNMERRCDHTGKLLNDRPLSLRLGGGQCFGP